MRSVVVEAEEVMNNSKSVKIPETWSFWKSSVIPQTTVDKNKYLNGACHSLSKAKNYLLAFIPGKQIFPALFRLINWHKECYKNTTFEKNVSANNSAVGKNLVRNKQG